MIRDIRSRQCPVTRQISVELARRSIAAAQSFAQYTWVELQLPQLQLVLCD